MIFLEDSFTLVNHKVAGLVGDFVAKARLGVLLRATVCLI